MLKSSKKQAWFIFIGIIIFLSILYVFKNVYKTYQFQTITSFQEINFDEFSQDDLVVFDVDETLVQPIDAYLINEHDNSIALKLFQAKALAQYPALLKDGAYYASIMYKEAQRPLIEPEIVHIIQKLQNRHVPVIACTFMNIGSFGVISSMEQWRFDHLQSLDIDFSKSFDIQNFAIQGTDRKPQFYKGILCADLISKGGVLGMFLDQVHFKPQKIIFFEDDYEYLVQVQEECKKRNIQFVGYHYHGAKKKPFNESLAWIQAKHLVENKTWLSDKQITASQSSLL